ncbi:MAG TPA: hypothetical protein VES68_02355 [Candidatus Sulfotelmatobacter sp.]|nr:hypothetical protein [Candidatus Sulfotelmatobacter sp.]
MPPETEILKSNSWDKSKHLFIDDFNPEQWNDISNFYHLSELIDENIKINNSYFEKNYDEYRVNLQKINTEIIRKYFEKTVGRKGSLTLQNIDSFNKLYLETIKPYMPADPVIRIEKYLSLIDDNILLNSTGSVLRKLAKLRI